VLDHVFTDAIGALREALVSAMLERQAFEERFQADVLLGDLTWETSYGLPGEGSPPRIRADITLDWPTWAQSSYRSWFIGEEFDEGPHIEVEIVLRMQRLTDEPDLRAVLAVLPETSPPIGDGRLDRSSPTVEIAYDRDLENPQYALEISYDGSYELGEAALSDGSILDDHFKDMGGWVASMLVHLGDVKLAYHPPDDEEHG
jgi:hypothetical protein